MEGSLWASKPERSAIRPPFSPPPSSAPSEFLATQWLALAPAPSPADAPAPVLTPPPPSAPSEFLVAQWRDGKTAHKGSYVPEMDTCAAAPPETIQSIEDLHRVIEEAQGAGQLSPPIEMELQKADEDKPARIRGVRLARGEDIAQVFLPDEGLTSNVPPSGQALILTNHRLIAFRGVEGFRDTHMAMASEITQCSVRTGQRNWGAVLQGFMIMLGGGFLYLIVGYWLAGQISGPNIPGINIDAAPFIALLIILAGLLVLLQNYFTRPAGAMIFHGEGVEIAFPFRSSLDVSQVYDFVDLAHSARRRNHTENLESDWPE